MPTFKECYIEAKAQLERHKNYARKVDTSLTRLVGILFKTDYEIHVIRTLCTHRDNALLDLHVARQRSNVMVFERRLRSFLVDIMGDTTEAIIDIEKSREELIVVVEESTGRCRAEAALRRLKIWAAVRGWTLKFLGDVDEHVVVAPGIAVQGEERKGEKEKGKEDTGEEAEKENKEEETGGYSVDAAMERLKAVLAWCSAFQKRSCE